MDGLELLTSVFLDDLARNPTATREENPAGAAPDSDAPPGPGTRPMSPPSTQPAWTVSAPPFLGAPAFRARQSLSRQGQDRRCLLAPLSTPAYNSASTPAVRWRATSFVQSYMWASLRKHLPFPHPQPGAAGVSLTDYLMLKNVIHSFQETRPFRMEQSGDGTFLKSPFADQVMGSS